MEFVKGYKDNVDLRNSFNQLANETFGISFESWYQNGFWTEKYQPYSFVDNGKVVANVSVNLLNLIINDEVKQAVQIGTVMTAPIYRNRGLSRNLMELVLEDFKHVDLIYLFANQTVLDFYPKFEFHEMEEVQFTIDFLHKPRYPAVIKRLNGSSQEDLSFIYKLAKNRKSISAIFGTTDSEELLMFYCMMVFNQDVYYLENENVLVIFQMEADCLHLHDIVSSKEINILSILSKIVPSDCKKVVFHFHLDGQGLGIEKDLYQSSNVLFIKNLTNVSLPKEFKHPLTSQA